jgi:hypothetical protein
MVVVPALEVVELLSVPGSVAAAPSLEVGVGLLALVVYWGVYKEQYYYRHPFQEAVLVLE